MISVRVKTTAGAVLPHYATPGSAGADIRACLEGHDADIIMAAGDTALIPTGLYFEIPVGYEVQVRPRSGLAAKYGVTVLNSPGTIDSDYRGEVKVILKNHGKEPYTVRHGDRIAQIVIAPVIQCSFDPADTIESTVRGTGGFGSTGR